MNMDDPPEGIQRKLRRIGHSTVDCPKIDFQIRIESEERIPLCQEIGGIYNDFFFLAAILTFELTGIMPNQNLHSQGKPNAIILQYSMHTMTQ